MNHQKTHQTNPMAPWDPLGIPLDPIAINQRTHQMSPLILWDTINHPLDPWDPQDVLLDPLGPPKRPP